MTLLINVNDHLDVYQVWTARSFEEEGSSPSLGTSEGAFPICSGAAKQAGIVRLAKENWAFFAS
jgi:hypothetical protein